MPEQAALANVENPETRWRIVVQPKKGMIPLKLAGRAQRWPIDTSVIDYSCKPTPLALSLADLPKSRTDVQLHSVAGEQWAETLSEVLDGFSDTIGLPPELAGPITEAHINAVTCKYSFIARAGLLPTILKDMSTKQRGALVGHASPLINSTIQALPAPLSLKIDRSDRPQTLL